MKWRFDDILTFINVVEAGSVTSAATRLNVSKSVISKRISDLEAALRVELFHRSTGSVKPTEAGWSFHERIVPLIRGITEATETVSQRSESLTGRLRVTAPISFGTNFLGPVIAEFAKRHPDLEIVVDYEDRFVNLTQGGYDLGIHMGDLKESSLKARKLCDCPRIVCCSPDYATNYGLPESIAELARHGCIDYARVRTSDWWLFEAESGEACIRDDAQPDHREQFRGNARHGDRWIRVRAVARIPSCRTSSRRQTDLGPAPRDAMSLYDFGCLSIYAPCLIQGARVH